MTADELLARVVDIAHAAGAAIMQIYGQAFTVTDKADASPITEADLAAHHLIFSALSALTPEIPQICEESPTPDWQHRRHWLRHWLIDPLDGTREFIKRNGEFTVNIALIENGLPIMGVIYAPALNQTYCAHKNSGAWQRIGDQRHALHTRPYPASMPVIMVSRSHLKPGLSNFLHRLGPHRAESVGSSLKFCRIAEGHADWYPRFGPISEWDTAAGQCILQESGGAVLALPHFQTMHYNHRDHLLTDEFFAVGDPAHDWAAFLHGSAS